ncbi:MAG: M23 family metallopeptidase [Calditrichaeota bacterium]|nr:M23 family metallopeptidase [Calditrichota bacterium]
MKRAIITYSILFLALFGLNPGLHAQNYLWPTSASKYLSSGFCEYRPGHYHSAIDIKTWNQEGYPCYAVDDGRIFRVRVSPFGYGKVLYLRLKDGRFAVYAHLKKFSDKLEKAIRKRQIQAGRYTVEWYPKNWRVKKGELIAYTGQTGIGVPHLHFEIRDPKQHPLNPLRFYKNDIKDKIAPLLQELLVLPLSKNSRVNGSFLPRTFLLVKTGSNSYKLKQPISARGTIGLAIRAYDKANDVYNRFNYYRAELLWDGKEIFEISYDTLYFSKTGQVDVEVYYPFKALQGKRFRKLFKEPFNTLPFYDRSLSGGYLNIDNKKHNFELIISDYFGNKSKVSGEIAPENDFTPVVELSKKFQNRAFIKLNLPRNIFNIELFASNDQRKWTPLNYYEILDHKFTAEGQSMLIKADLEDSNSIYLRMDVKTDKDRRFSTLIDLQNTPERLNAKLLNLGKYWVLQAAPLNYIEGLELFIERNGRRLKYQPQIYGKTLEAVLEAGEQKSGNLRVKLATRQKTLLDTSIQYGVFFPGRKQTQSYSNDRLRIQTGAETVYDTLIYRLEVSDSVPRFDGVPVLSPIYRFDWYPQIFRKPALISIQYDSLNIPQRTIGIYAVDSRSRLSFVGSNVDSIEKRVSAKIKTLNGFVAAADTTAPLLKIQFPKERQILANLNEVRFITDDTLSGIDSDLDIRIFIDRRLVIPEWDPERRLVTGHPDRQLEEGDHELRITVKDRAGNIAQKTLSFTIKKGNKL